MCDEKVFLTFTSLSLVLLWKLFYLFCSSIVIYTVFHSFPVVDWFCLFIYLWVLTFPCKIVRSSVILLLPSLSIVLSVFSYLFLWSLYCLSLRTFSFGHCIVCLIVPFSLIIVLSVFIRFTASHFQPSFLVFVYCK
jgi:hypothetical protein